MQFLDERFERVQTFRSKLYHQQVKQKVIQKIAESGLAYHDLENLFSTAGKKGLVAVLSKAPKSTRSSRGTNKAAILSKIVHHFEKNTANSVQKNAT